MVQFVCDDNKVEIALRKLCDQVTQYGGTVHKDLTIESREGDFFILLPDSMEEGERILVIPKDILLPVNKYKIVTVAEEMVLQSYDDDLNNGQIALMETMLELYNLVGKVDQLQRTSTIDVLHKYPDFFKKIITERQQESSSFLSKTKNEPKDTYWISLYMKARVFGLDMGRLHIFAENSAVKNVVHEPMLMPIVDFINHNPNASAFNTSFEWIDNEVPRNGDDGIFVTKSCPIEGSRECYVHYGAYDAMETFIHYNYVETSAEFVRSVPLNMKISGVGTVNIKSTINRPNVQELPENVEDLRFFIPEFTYDSQERLLEISFLFIPQSLAPRALRRTLNFVLEQIEIPLDKTLRREIKLEIEKCLIQKNMRYYTDLSSFLGSFKVSARNELVLQNARLMADTQLTKIRHYPFYKEAMQST